ncbi:metal-sensitive transcriptional regulator [Paracoccus sp. (in: a-proteobacteria)]|uniref:metal-sensitive transcriptional regulator n=1 Tax=Paracoccus sp. TaxID=267 RepID=UPI0035B08D29
MDGEKMKDRKQAALNRLARLEGQVRGIARMIEEDRYCIDILNQAMAVRSALSQVELLILQDHADDCVDEAIMSQDTELQRQKFRELVEVFGKVCR